MQLVLGRDEPQWKQAGITRSWMCWGEASLGDTHGTPPCLSPKWLQRGVRTAWDGGWTLHMGLFPALGSQKELLQPLGAAFGDLCSPLGDRASLLLFFLPLCCRLGCKAGIPTNPSQEGVAQWGWSFLRSNKGLDKGKEPQVVPGFSI